MLILCAKKIALNAVIHFFISFFFYLPYIYKILQFKVGIMRLKKYMARRPERNHEAYNESGLLNLG